MTKCVPIVSENCLLNLQAELADLASIEAEAIAWQPLSDGTYLHLGKQEEVIITVTGIPDAAMAGMNVLLVG